MASFATADATVQAVLTALGEALASDAMKACDAQTYTTFLFDNLSQNGIIAAAEAANGKSAQPKTKAKSEAQQTAQANFSASSRDIAEKWKVEDKTVWNDKAKIVHREAGLKPLSGWQLYTMCKGLVANIPAQGTDGLIHMAPKSRK